MLQNTFPPPPPPLSLVLSLSLSLSLYTHTHIHKHTHTNTNTHIRTRTRTRTHARAHTHLHTHQVPATDKFEPLMTLFLTHNLTPDDIKAASAGTLLHPHTHPHIQTRSHTHHTHAEDRILRIVQANRDSQVEKMGARRRRGFSAGARAAARHSVTTKPGRYFFFAFIFFPFSFFR